MGLALKAQVEFKILDARLNDWGLPRYHSDMAAAVDLHACIDQPLLLSAGSAARLVPAGFAMHMANANLAAVILPRSGAGHGRGLVLGNLQGLIDGDFTGPVMISVWNRNPLGTEPIAITPGERIAQMMFLPIVRADFQIVEEFSVNSKRGQEGFGSTGIAPSTKSGQDESRDT